MASTQQSINKQARTPKTLQVFEKAIKLGINATAGICIFSIALGIIFGIPTGVGLLMELLFSVDLSPQPSEHSFVLWLGRWTLGLVITIGTLMFVGALYVFTIVEGIHKTLFGENTRNQ